MLFSRQTVLTTTAILSFPRTSVTWPPQLSPVTSSPCAPPLKPLSDEEIEELISDLLAVESKAAEAQEALEKESLSRVESEVREELAQTLHGDELDKAVAAEMMTYRDEWEATLDELETESANLLEQLDGAGIELPKLYEMIESQAPNGCYTEAWKQRAHWVGSKVTKETVESLANAEKFLHTHRPVRKKHGKLLEEGASGFLEKKFADDDAAKECIAGTSELDWSSLNKVFSEKRDEAISFGSKHWASVYLASTPQQAAAMGLEFPGVNEVEEIEEIDASLEDPFFADAIENERELALSEEQKKNYIRVKEEDDINIDRELQLRLKRKRRKKKSKQGIRRVAENRDDDSAYLDGNSIFSNPAEDQVKSPGTSTQFQVEIPFKPARVLLQDFTGLPAVVDLACMRDAMNKLGSDSNKINPLVHFIFHRSMQYVC